MEYFIHLAILVSIYLILALAFNLVFGFGRLLNLAHVSVFAIGAYVTALFSTEFGIRFAFCALESMALSAFFALLIGAIAIKLSDDYFAIGTLAFAAVTTALLINWKSVTRGVLGIPGIPRPDLFGIDFYDNTNFLILSGTLAVLVAVSFKFIYSSRLGRSLKALAENESAALSLGLNTKRIRNIGFAVSSLFAGLAGSLFAAYINYVDPTMFNLTEMVFVLSIVIVGRPGSFWGVIAATFFLVLLPEPLRFLEIPSDILGPMRQMLHAVILFGVVYWKRFELFPVQRHV